MGPDAVSINPISSSVLENKGLTKRKIGVESKFALVDKTNAIRQGLESCESYRIDV